MNRLNRSGGVAWLGACLVVAGLAACSQQAQSSAAPEVEEKTFALTPGTAAVKTSFLSGTLQDMKVTQLVEQGTGRVVDPPELRATLELENTSDDQAARLLGGKIEYVDAEGKLIPLAEGRQDTSFQFYSYRVERLEPGMEASTDVEVPFPAAGLVGKKLRDIRLELSYIPTPYREDTVDIQVSLGQ
ncbi:MAG: hypothetical protein ACREMB_03625 [Candidatus Rokuibacteriota bacterium]